jgi:protein-S-isoprenylcysteine O-methyltransferase Ste14
MKALLSPASLRHEDIRSRRLRENDGAASPRGRSVVRPSRPLLGGAILLYFVIGLEILIMISPFAAFFYAAFNPFLLSLARHEATRWLSAFFLPHMVSPPDLLLKTVRVAGSVFFVLGSVIFLVCAFQVYANKLLRRGVATRGFYSFVRHPQYLGLGLTGLGLAILWPRFLVPVLWIVMLVFYDLLARDEERRMLAKFGESYREYTDKTGMFLPRAFEDLLAARSTPRRAGVRRALAFTVLAGVTIGGAFALRIHTVAALPLWSNGPVTTLAILPGDLPMVAHRMETLLDLAGIRSRTERSSGPLLVYFLPKDYIMQGMIADTGGEWRLFKQHHAGAMIADWIFHPFRHLEGGHGKAGHGAPQDAMPHAGMNGIVRRLIFLRVETPTGGSRAADLFAIGAKRTPLFAADVDVHEVRLEGIQDLSPGTGWGRVPTPVF